MAERKLRGPHDQPQKHPPNAQPLDVVAPAAPAFGEGMHDHPEGRHRRVDAGDQPTDRPHNTDRGDHLFFLVSAGAGAGALTTTLAIAMLSARSKTLTETMCSSPV